MNRLKAAVRNYKNKYKPMHAELIDWYRSQESLVSAIDSAAQAFDQNQKRHPHQRRLQEIHLLRARSHLLGDIEQIEAAVSFEDILRIVVGISDRVDGLGELFSYDTALRIGAFLNIFPDRVYLHAGTRSGAKAVGFDGKRQTLEMEELSEALQILEPHEVEDFLCIFKGLLD